MKVRNHCEKIGNNIFIFLELKKETKLHMVRVRFGTFSLDRVTKHLKTNWIDKLSHFGGTAGLFTGCSFISAFEFLPFIMTLLIMLCQYLTNKNKKLRTVHVQESEVKENEKKYEDMEQNFNIKFASFERALESLEKKIDQQIIGN